MSNKGLLKKRRQEFSTFAVIFPGHLTTVKWLEHLVDLFFGISKFCKLFHKESKRSNIISAIIAGEKFLLVSKL